MQLLHFNNILHYAQYCNCSISIISCTMYSTATAPFQWYPALCTVLQLLHFNNTLQYAKYPNCYPPVQYSCVKFSFLLCSTHIDVYIVKWHQLDITLSQTVHKSSHLYCTMLSHDTQSTISVQTVAYWNVTIDGSARTIAICCDLSENEGST